MRTLLALWRLLGASLHVAHGLWIVLVHFPAWDHARRMQRVQWWSARLLKRLGVRLQATGTPRRGGKLLVANHVSWLDILALDALAPARFVSKSEVRGWPLIGRLVGGAGTLYIERERTRDALRVVHRMAEALNAGDTVAIFPEGTTSHGHAVLPFHANLLQAAIATAAPVQAVALRYSDASCPVSPAAAYVGETHLLSSVWSVVCARDLVAHVHFIAAHAAAHADRRALAQSLRESIARELVGSGACEAVSSC